jgi:hypothetical protein
MQHHRARGDEEEEKEEAKKFKSVAAANSSIVICRNCGETGHWTLKCPKRGVRMRVFCVLDFARVAFVALNVVG